MLAEVRVAVLLETGRSLLVLEVEQLVVGQLLPLEVLVALVVLRQLR